MTPADLYFSTVLAAFATELGEHDTAAHIRQALGDEA